MNILARNKRLLNPFGENITIFHVEEGETIKEGDFVVVNTRTWQASKPKKAGGYYSVGRAVRIIASNDGCDLVVCKDGIFQCGNTKDSKHHILKNDVSRACYFKDTDTVSMDKINTTRAGEIISVFDDGVLIKIDVNEGSGMEW